MTTTAGPTTTERKQAAAPTVGPRPWSAEEHRMTLLSEDLARERIHEREREIEVLHAAARVRAMRRARRDAHVRVARVRRILLSR